MDLFDLTYQMLIEEFIKYLKFYDIINIHLNHSCDDVSEVIYKKNNLYLCKLSSKEWKLIQSLIDTNIKMHVHIKSACFDEFIDGNIYNFLLNATNLTIIYDDWLKDQKDLLPTLIEKNMNIEKLSLPLCNLNYSSKFIHLKEHLENLEIILMHDIKESTLCDILLIKNLKTISLKCYTCMTCNLYGDQNLVIIKYIADNAKRDIEIKIRCNRIMNKIQFITAIKKYKIIKKTNRFCHIKYMYINEILQNFDNHFDFNFKYDKF